MCLWSTFRMQISRHSIHRCFQQEETYITHVPFHGFRMFSDDASQQLEKVHDAGWSGHNTCCNLLQDFAANNIVVLEEPQKDLHTQTRYSFHRPIPSGATASCLDAICIDNMSISFSNRTALICANYLLVFAAVAKNAFALAAVSMKIMASCVKLWITWSQPAVADVSTTSRNTWPYSAASNGENSDIQ